MSRRRAPRGDGRGRRQRGRRAPAAATHRGPRGRALLAAGTAAVLLAAFAATHALRSGSAPAAARPTPTPAQPETPVHGYELVREYPHDPGAFTQGLIYRGGFLYESTGLEGRSSLRRVDLETGKVLQRRDLDSRYFAEGLTDWNGTLIQLTYRNGIAFVYDAETFADRSSFSYRGEGWGLTHDGRRLIMSDGTPRLRFLDAETGRETGTLTVTDRGLPVDELNELEFVRGEIYANVWHSDRIAAIDPASGAVRRWIDLTGLRPAAARDPEAVLNGIAYDAAGDRLFVTGKLWPALFEIRVRDR